MVDYGNDLPPRPPRFHEHYESLSDHEVANIINPFAAKTKRSLASHKPTARSLSHGSGDLSLSCSPIDTMMAAFIAPSPPLNPLLHGPTTIPFSSSPAQVRMAFNSGTSGMAGFLEMEEEPTRLSQADAERVLKEQDDLIDFTTSDEPISTTSGLLLTHRRSYTEKKALSQRHAVGAVSASHRPSPNRLEVDWGREGDSYGSGRAPRALQHARRMLSFAKLWVLFFCFVLMLGTAVLVHTFRRESGGIQQAKKSEKDLRVRLPRGQDEDSPNQILLLPLENASKLARQQREAEKVLQELEQEREGRGRRLLINLSDLRVEFEEWIVRHGKDYATLVEKERRFEIWVDNHHRTSEKNKRHGDCPLLKKPVFGSNHLSDLTPEEFQLRFLTGYDGPNADGSSKTGRQRKLSRVHAAPVMHGGLNVTRHPAIHQRVLQHWKASGVNMASSSSCKWYDVSCWMRVMFQEYLYVGTGTMEPKYDSDTYPTSFDWRDYGAVTDVRRQGDCGACWAITAVETIESAYFLGTNTLLDLSETEVISCTDSCNMCYGGWPQDAYDYVMDHNGISLSDDWGYDGDTLLAVSQELEVDESELDSDLFASYINENCPASGNSGGDARYGKIEGYGFATERCVCYSDGSGCDCDNQNEGMAVRNVASYGPATVCLDASVWQDYEGGIITSSSGCSAEFLSMNHCVQVVGYAYNDGSGNGSEDGEGGNSGSGSNSHSHDSGSASQDSSRVGYWIVRNQWSGNWGMNGYAYVAMGENTCGILNDMTQAYM